MSSSAPSVEEIGHRLGDAYRGFVTMFSKVPTESKFAVKGTLTPEEFVAAGDALVTKFPTWQWAPAAKASYEQSYLPKEKQYLVTRGVPCFARVKDLEDSVRDVVITSAEDEDGWLQTGESHPVYAVGRGNASSEEEETTEITAAVEEGQQPAAKSDTQARGPTVVVVEDYGDEEANAAISALDSLIAPGGAAASPVVVPPPDESEDLRRSYDLSITWDKYYQTPRLWLSGFDRFGQPLAPERIFEDVLTEYRSKTVTVDPHPCTGIPCASIHPCRHAEMMLRVIQSWQDAGEKVQSELALLVFLKFISGVVPTINYDFTADVTIRGGFRAK
ncbi:E2-like enzyme [Perkinsus olseni]|uniref:E2-like enzyme n=1 Tax=Perkinsus olseni TaxID=32597 RepID=A0A7J6Q5D3_PEROL|nr:E2-like enzyme [Perkinsus olseni]